MTNAWTGTRSGDLAGAHLAGAQWRKSHYSSPQGNCVEIAALPGGRVAVRDSRHPSGSALIFGRMEWVTFISSVRARPTPVSATTGKRTE